MPKHSNIDKNRFTASRFELRIAVAIKAVLVSIFLPLSFLSKTIRNISNQCQNAQKSEDEIEEMRIGATSPAHRHFPQVPLG